MNTIDVSVIISTKNEEKNIANCLQSIKKQQYPQKKIEIIVVDNYSTDKAACPPFSHLSKHSRITFSDKIISASIISIYLP
ncbi:MAG TPA: glycosyltransferase [bacterium]|nr:glycosyltransferase [bacterium]